MNESFRWLIIYDLVFQGSPYIWTTSKLLCSQLITFINITLNPVAYRSVLLLSDTNSNIIILNNGWSQLPRKLTVFNGTFSKNWQWVGAYQVLFFKCCKYTTCGLNFTWFEFHCCQMWLSKDELYRGKSDYY